MKSVHFLLGLQVILSGIGLSAEAAGAATAWPRPILCRVQDSRNEDLFVMTLGDVNTPIANGVFDPVKDQVKLKDGTVIGNYYRDVLKIKYFAPIDKSRFAVPPSGWCSWYFYYQDVDANEVKLNAKWMADNLKDYGAVYVQLDDGWQGTGHGSGANRDWTTIDKRFSSGMDQLAAYIKSLGMTPGLWLAPHGQSDPNAAKRDPSVFLLKPDGTSASDTWEGKFLVDPSTAQSQAYLKDLFTKLAGWGYEYFKIDGQPIVVREYRNKKSFMKSPSDDTDALYRKTLESIRQGIGPDRYLLGCWLVPAEGMGIFNGSRVSADVISDWRGFKAALRATMQYYFLHNVAWYCDLDAMLLRPSLTLEQARAWATLQGLTGQALMTSDRMMDLSRDRVELARRVYPAVDIRPLDLFTSHRNKRIWDLKVNHLGRQYDVAGVFNFDEGKPVAIYVNWRDLGLPDDKPVHVFDFWNKEYLGAWEKGMAVRLPATSCRVLTLTPAADHVQLVSTSRHITQGWVDLVSLNYDPATNTYTGKSKVIRNDPYELRFASPRDRNLIVKTATASALSGDLPVRVYNHDGWSAVEIVSPATTEVSWQVSFEPAGAYHRPVREPENLWVARAGFGGVDLGWTPQLQTTGGYRVYLDGRLLGYTHGLVFPLRDLDSARTYTAEVETVWLDGTASEKKAQLKFSLNSLLPAEISLSDIEPSRVKSGWRQAEFNRTILETGFMLDGKPHSSGVGIPPNSEIEYELKGRFKDFSALVGIDDGNSRDGQVEFVLLGDGKELYKSGMVTKKDAAKHVDVDIPGVNRLILRVNRGPQGGPADEADWVDVTLGR